MVGFCNAFSHICKIPFRKLCTFINIGYDRLLHDAVHCCSEEASKVAARRITRILQKLGFRVRFCNFRVVNVLGTCSLPWGIRITHFSNEHKENARYKYVVQAKLMIKHATEFC
jgi:hypothetical protein